MSESLGDRHKWTIAGRDDEAGVPNLWRCKRCKIYKAEAPTAKAWKTEYSTEDGEVIGPKPPPFCEG